MYQLYGTYQPPPKRVRVHNFVLPVQDDHSLDGLSDVTEVRLVGLLEEYTMRNIRVRNRSVRRCEKSPLYLELLEDRTLLDATGLPPLQVDANSYDASHILVRFHPDANIVQLNTGQFLSGTSIAGELTLVSDLYKVSLAPGTPVEDALAAFRSNPLVAYAEPDYEIRVTAIPNDPSFSQLWGLNNTGQTGGTPDVDIDAPEAWDINTGSGNTIVAVIDTGVDYLHPDLAANMWVNGDEIAGNSIDDDGNGYIDDIHGYDFFNNDGNPMDDHNHGTHVAGTIGAVGNNGVGIAGVNWNVQIMALKFLGANGSGSVSDAIEAIEYAVANGATISSNSWGFNGNFSQPLYDAISSARDEDHIFVAAAGNGNAFGFGQDNDVNPFYPASLDLDNIVVVAATDHNDNRAIFSNFGAVSVDLAAPGVNIYSTTRNNTYSAFNGTSMATPHVSGVVALVRDLYPEWSYAQVISHLYASVDPIASMQDITTTGGRLNAHLAVQPPPVNDLNWTEGGVVAPATTTTADLFTVQRTYTVSGEAIAEDFTISYHASRDTTFGNSDDFFLGSETITATADKALGSHAGTSPGLKIPHLGNVHVFARLDSDGDVRENSELNNLVHSPQPILVTGSAIIDDGDSGYSETGSGWGGWINGYNGDHRFTAAGSGASKAVWEFTNLVEGNYQIHVSWLAETNRATDAPYRIYDGETLRRTIRINQQQVPVGIQVNGTPFQALAELPIYSGTLRIELANDANNYVIPDAVRLSTLPPPAIDLALTGGNFTGPTSATTDAAFTVDRTYTISGEAAGTDFTISYYASRDTTFGNSDDFLIGSETITAAPDKALGSHSGTAGVQIHTGGSFYLYAKLDDDRDILETDENNNVALAAQQIDVSGPVIIDDGDPGYSEVGAGWFGWINGFNDDHRFVSAGTGSKKAVWEFTGLEEADYEIQATWLAFANRATNAPYRIYDGGSLLETVRVNQQLVPTGTVIGPSSFQTLTTVRITSGTLRVELANDANNFVIADAVRPVALPPKVTDVSWDNGGIIAPNSADTDSTFTVDRTYTIGGEPAVSDFTISYYASRDAIFGNSDDLFLGSETITTAAGKAPGTHTGTSPSLQIPLLGNVHVFAQIDSGDAIRETEEGNNIALAQQTIVGTGSVIVDDGEPGYSEVGSGWFGGTVGYQNDHRFNAAGNGSDRAIWEFNGLLAGNYEIQATWLAFSNRATDAPYRIYDGATLLDTVRVNQQLIPSGVDVDGHAFQKLTSVYISSGTLRIELADDANNYVIPDAIRVVTPDLDLNWANGGITGPASTTTESTFTINRTYAIDEESAAADFSITYYASRDAVFGNGDDLLIGSEIISSASDKTVGSHTGTSPALQISDLGNFYLFARLDGIGVILEMDEANNLAQAAQTVLVTGSTIKDDGDPGYTETGSNWFGWINGHAGDHRFNAAGTGANKASWEFTGLVDGYYEIQVTWLAETNRATDAPYRIYNGTTLLDTIRVNQQLLPTGTDVNGSSFQTLTTVHVSGTLRIELANDANNYVIADAVRLVTVPTPTIDLNWTGGGISAPASAAIGSPFTLDRTYTVSGGAANGDFTIAYYASRDAVFGNADDVLLGTEVIGAADRTEGTHTGTSPTFQIANLGNFHLFARLDDGTAMLETNEANNVIAASEPLFVEGELIIEDGNPGYWEIGPDWFGASLGYENDHRFNAAGTGSNKAVWEFTGLGEGDYEIQATWLAFGNRASNAPYRIYDGATLLGTIRVDQRLVPNGPTVNGSPFQTLATVHVSSGVLRIELANDADNYVIADAVRIVALAPQQGAAIAGGQGPFTPQYLAQLGRLLTSEDVPASKVLDHLFARFTPHNQPATPFVKTITQEDPPSDSSVRATDRLFELASLRRHHQSRGSWLDFGSFDDE